MRPLFGNRLARSRSTPTQGSPRAAKSAHRRAWASSLLVEPLEERRLLTTTAFEVQPLAAEEIQAVALVEAPEPNDTLATATFLGSEPTVTLPDLAIDTTEDIDYFRYTAHDTGKLVINAVFDATQGALSVEARDALDNVIATGTVTADGQQMLIPVVSQQSYYVRIASSAEGLNTYALELENFAAPVPSAVTLDPVSDTGWSNGDSVTSRSTGAHFFISADLSDLAASGITILSPAQATAGVTPGAAVQVFVNGTSVGYATAVAGTDNTLFEITLNADLTKFSTGGPNAAGPAGYSGFTNLLTAAVRVFDLRENGGGAPNPANGRAALSSPVPVIFDNIAPIASTTPDLLSATDNGTSPTDNLTSINQPAFTGTAEANARIRIRANGITVGSGVVGSDSSDGVPGNGLGLWQVTIDPLANGAYDITAVVEDAAGNTGPASGILTVTIDASTPQRPTIDLVDTFDAGLSNKDNITNQSTLNFLVSAEAGATVVIKDGNNVIDTFVMPGAPFTTRVLNLGEGPHPLSAEATDTAGNRSAQSEELLVTVDTAAPAPPSAPDLLPTSDSGDTDADNFTQVNPPAFQGTAEPNSRVFVTANGVIVGQGLVGSDLSDQLLGNLLGRWEVTVEPLADGTYNVAAFVEDAAGNFSAPSVFTVITLDTVPPQRPTLDLLDGSDSGSSDGDNITNIGAVTVRVSAEQGQAVVIKDGETVIDSFTMPAGGFTTRLLNLADGAHPLSAEATDTAGNRSAQSEELLVRVDTVAPAPPTEPDLLPSSDSGPSDSDGVTKVNPPAFQGTGEANAQVRIYANGILIGQGIVGSDATEGDPESEEGVINGLGHWEVTVEPLADGLYDITAVVEDAAGNISAPSVTFVLVLDTLPPQRPTIDLLSGSDTGSGNVDNITFAIPQEVRVSAEEGATVVIKDGETVIDSFVMPAGGFTTRTLTLLDGPHPLSAEATDAAGNRSAQSDELLLTVDTVAPEPPSVPDLLPSSDSGPSLLDGITSVNPPAFQGTGEANALVRIYADGVLIGQGVVGSDATDGVLGNGLGHWEVTVEPLADGEYEITAVLEDAAGNVSEPSEAFLLVLDTLAPQRPTIDLVDAFDTGKSNLDNVTNLNTLNFLVSAEPGSNVVIKDGNTVIDSFVMPAAMFTTRTLILTDGPHPLSAEATDDAGNRSAQSEELLVTVDSVAPTAPTAPDLLASSDTGTFNNDNVTFLQALAFSGTGEANARVRIFANGLLVGQGIVGTDLTDPPAQLPDNPPAIGAWEITSEPLGDGTWTITAVVEDQAGNISTLSSTLIVNVDSIKPNVPYLDLTDSSDTGRNNYDNLTRDNTPTVTSTVDDVQGAATNAFPHDVRYRIYDRPGTGADVLLVDSFATIPGFSTNKFFTDTLSTLADGVHNLKLEVEDRAGNISEFLLSVTIDTAAPPVFWGNSTSATDGLDPASDSGVTGDLTSFTDRITNVTRPSFFGTAEANAVIRVYVDDQQDHLIPLGIAVAIPLDGNQAFPGGQWNLTSIVDLNDPALFPHDGIRHLVVTAEDPAGNISNRQTLAIFIDTQGPQITDVHITGNPDFNLFGLKPGNAAQGPTPLITELTISLQDLPFQDAAFLRNAIEAGIASTPGIITLVGDHSGVIKIDSITAVNRPPIAGLPANASIVLHFNTPLPDDRFTLTVHDTLPDIAGNALDGENNAIEPTGFPLFPTGDGQPGGDFVARFTVDSRPEIGSYAAASVYIDINGNLIHDPQGQDNDATNRDLTFGLGIVPSLIGVVSPMGVHDGVFAGNFPGLRWVNGDGDDGGEAAVAQLQPIQALWADGFDKLAAYGYDVAIGKFRWLIDTNNDGIIDPAAGDHATIQGANYQINGLPVAGDFDGDPDNGDEIGLFDGTKWYFDTNHNWVIDGGDLVRTSSLRGTPIVGDFNGDGVIDLATWREDRFYFNFGTQPGGMGTQPNWNGNTDATINWGLPGTAELPVAEDMDGDGITDIGLFLPPRTGTMPLEGANWEFLISNDFAQNYRGGNQVTALNHPFSPAPLGNDLFAQFGDSFALPIVGNFDPPVASPALPAAIDTGDLLGKLPLGTQTINGEVWYSFTPLRSGMLTVSATSSAGKLTTNLYDTDYKLLGSSAATAVAQTSLRASVNAGQTYLLRLTGQNATADIQLSNQVPDADRLDVSRDGIISGIDALRVINELLNTGMQATPLAAASNKMYLDTNLDGRISAVDVLQVINYLLAHPGVPSAAPQAATGPADLGAEEPSAAPLAAAASQTSPTAGDAIAVALAIADDSGDATPQPAAADLVFGQLATPVPASSNAAALPGEGSDSGSDDDLFVDDLSDEPVADDDWLS